MDVLAVGLGAPTTEERGTDQRGTGERGTAARGTDSSSAKAVASPALVTNFADGGMRAKSTTTGAGASGAILTHSPQISGQLVMVTAALSLPVGGQRLCFPPSAFSPTDQWASGFGTIAERFIQQDYCTTPGISCIRGPMGTVYIDNYNPKEYIDFLKAHNPSLNALPYAAKLAAYVAAGFKRPDILSDYSTSKEYYEIKPLSPSGVTAGAGKLAFIVGFMASLGLPYRAGTTYSPSKDIPIMSGIFLGEPLAVFLRVQRFVPGIITYSLCLSGNLTGILAKVALVALLAWIATQMLTILAI
jgi:hypothetical protein